jgi:hypothetical protein
MVGIIAEIPKARSTAREHSSDMFGGLADYMPRSLLVPVPAPAIGDSGVTSV